MAAMHGHMRPVLSYFSFCNSEGMLIDVPSEMKGCWPNVLK